MPSPLSPSPVPLAADPRRRLPASGSTPVRRIDIVGGGLAGLSLGLALRRRGVPVTLHEAGTYPRHRVCGEFIRGLREETITTLGLAPLLADAQRHHEVAWFARGQLVRRHALPQPALGLSRHVLDARLAAAFVAAGGDLIERSRADATPQEGRVLACGRRADAHSPWLGLKVHVHSLRLDRGLEMHLGHDAYVGLCGLANGVANVCGLFRRRTGPAQRGAAVLLAHLEAAGLSALAARLRAADIDDASFCAVAGLAFGPTDAAGSVALGDAFAMIPPFTGNGMAMAFASAACALEPCAKWAHSGGDWPDTQRRIRDELHRRFRVRLGVAALCHPFLLNPRRQPWLSGASRAGVLPVSVLQRLLS